MKELRFGDVRSFALGHRASKWQNQFELVLSVPKAYSLFITVFLNGLLTTLEVVSYISGHIQLISYNL